MHFIRYLNQSKGWIFLFIVFASLTDLIIFLDRGLSIPVSSVVYLNLLLLVIFIVYFIWRYRKEKGYLDALHSLTNELHEDWLEALPVPYDAKDAAMSEALHAIDQFYRKKVADSRESHLIESDYTTSWVHEVKAPLTAMKLIIDANRKDSVVRKIEAEWLRIHLLIDQQLYIARLPFLQSDYVLKAASIQKLASSEVLELASWCVEKNVAVEFEGKDQEVLTDSKWCRFIIRQLLTNAVKYSPVGGIITISSNITQTGNVVLTIQDEGPGIPAHDLPRIFDKGFTGGNGRLQNAASGLGLYLAQTVAIRIGITLSVQSEQSQGTLVRIMFTAKNEYETIRS